VLYTFPSFFFSFANQIGSHNFPSLSRGPLSGDFFFPFRMQTERQTPLSPPLFSVTKSFPSLFSFVIRVSVFRVSLSGRRKSFRLKCLCATVPFFPMFPPPLSYPCPAGVFHAGDQLPFLGPMSQLWERSPFFSSYFSLASFSDKMELMDFLNRCSRLEDQFGLGSLCELPG